MHSYAPVLLALASTAFAVPRHEHGHQRFHERREFNYPNGTAIAAGPTAYSTEASTLTVVETKTVVPVAVAQSAAAYNGDAKVIAAAVASSSAAAGGECGATATVTETEVVTVTLGGNSGSGSTSTTIAAGGSYAGGNNYAAASASSSTPYYPLSNSSLPEFAPSGKALQVEAVATSSSSSSVVAQTTSSVNFAGYAYGAASSSSSATTFSTTTSSSASTSSTSTSSSSGKRGLAYNDASLTDLFSGYSTISWAYNWGATTSSIASDLEFVPMLWGSKDYDSWSSDAQSAISSGSSHLLAFNEPDMSSQANMGYADAASAYQTYMNPFSGSASLGSPAVTNSQQSGQGLEWMESFLESCNGACDIDFLVVHWYAGYDATDDFKSHVSSAIELAEKYSISKVWITEFQATGTLDQQVTFLDTILPWLDEQSAVERYSYFMCATETLLETVSSLSQVGTTYAS